MKYQNMEQIRRCILTTIINLNEVFGPTIQGEGIHAGQLVGFVRLANCNLACSWCDTPYSWDWSRFDKAVEVTDYTIDDLVQVIKGWKVSRVILTGGEPLMQQDALIKLAQKCSTIKFDIETNGTIAPKPELAKLIDMFCVSPKLSHSGDVYKKRIKNNSLHVLSDLAKEGKAIFKFVCQEEANFEEIELVREEFSIGKEHIWIMPEGLNIESQLATLNKLADAVVSHYYNLTTRLHILAWGSKRGV